jgi:hypothetical protein
MEVTTSTSGQHFAKAYKRLDLVERMNNCPV